LCRNEPEDIRVGAFPPRMVVITTPVGLPDAIVFGLFHGFQVLHKLIVLATI